ncbi:DUF3883 domain-containing protein [Paenibacillus nicotianae]|uniref:DUF3883 domain-containing protein n=1 Tax=Paenibacillus nicotianae TaxID=1526551 RepID=A0ABW4UXR2_9BACL
MLIDLSKQSNLGSLEEIIYVIKNVLSIEAKKLRDIEKFCLNNSYFYNIPIKGIISFLEFISAISNNHDTISLTKLGLKLKNTLHSEKIKEKLIKVLLQKILIERIYPEFINPENITYDYIYNLYTIKNNYIPFRYSAIKNLFINLGFFEINLTTKNLLFINHFYNDFLKKILKSARKKMSLIKFKEIQTLKEQYGHEAEEFVLQYEKNRIKEYEKCKKILKISDIDVGAGYDIISYESIDSIGVDIFIEVKSYTKKAEFFWTKNEIEVSKTKGESYYLYLIDRENFKTSNYKPYIIKNPYKFVFQNNFWNREPQNWFFSKYD